jgi:hypothetical protein
MPIAVSKKRLILGISVAATLGLFGLLWFAGELLGGRLNNKNIASEQLAQRRIGLYQLAYDEESPGHPTVKLPSFIELQPDRQWIMYKVLFSDAPIRGTYQIVGDTITFVEKRPGGIIYAGRARPNPVQSGRFKGQDILITALANGLVTGPDRLNSRYIKVPYLTFDQQNHSASNALGWTST